MSNQAQSNPNSKCPIYKLFFLGDTGAGKTCFINCLKGEEFNENSLSSTGIDNYIKDYTPTNSTEVIAKLQIWDTAGQERFASISQNMIKNADGIVLLYDITNKHSFDTVSKWIDSIDKNMPVILVGNKKDLENKRKVSEEEGKAFAHKSQYMFFESSVKTKYNIDAIEGAAASLMMKRNPKQQTTKNIVLNSKDFKKKKKGNCCLQVN